MAGQAHVQTVRGAIPVKGLGVTDLQIVVTMLVDKPRQIFATGGAY